MLSCAGIGILIGLVWATTYSIIALPAGAAGAVAVSPIIEEAIRFASLSAMYSWKRTRAVPVLTRGIGFGLGFGGTEALLRWSDALAPESRSTVISFVAPVPPMLLHILLSLVLSKLMSLDRPWLGFLICLALHSGYNSYVWFVLIRAETVGLALLQLAVLFFVVLGALLWSLRAWQKKPT